MSKELEQTGLKSQRGCKVHLDGEERRKKKRRVLETLKGFPAQTREWQRSCSKANLERHGFHCGRQNCV